MSNVQERAQLEPITVLPARWRAYWQADDVDGLVANCYTADARLHSFRFRATGKQTLTATIDLYYRRCAAAGSSQVEFQRVGSDFIWQELTIAGPAGDVKLYEFAFLRDGRIYLQLLGERQGTVWQAGDWVDMPPPVDAAVERLHRRYLAYHMGGDADGMVNKFFTTDARLITTKVQVENREELRQLFQKKYREERGFHLESVRNRTGDNDYVWFEATTASSLGSRTVYDVMLLRDDKVRLQLVGALQGTLPINGIPKRS